MTLPSITPRVTHSGNGTTTSWAYPFRILANADMVVIVTDPAGVETTLASGYTVIGAGNPNGGLVAYPTSGAALASGWKITLLRRTEIVQPQDLDQGAAAYFETIETAIDVAMMVAQDQQDQLSRAVKVPVASGLDPDDYLTTIEGYQAAAASSAAAASASQGAATTKAAEAAASAAAASGSEGVATTKAADAAASAVAASASEGVATTKAAEADASAAAALASELASAASATAASASEGLATTKASEAAASATAALASQSASAASALASQSAATAAAASAAAASGSEGIATTKAADAAASAVAALASQSAATASATAASVSEGAATTKAAEADASAAAALASELAAAQSAADAQAVHTFTHLAVAGQTTLDADQAGDTLTLAAGANVAITTNAATDTATIAVTGLGTAAALNVGTGANQIVQRDASGKYPAGDGSAITNISAGNVSGLVAMDQAIRDQIALTNLRLLLNTSVSTGALAQGWQWEFGSDEWAAGNTNATFTGGTPNYYGNSATLSQLPYNTGTVVSNADLRASAAFDDNLSQASGSAAKRTISPKILKVGKDWGAGNTKTVSRFDLYGTTDYGFIETNVAQTVRVRLLGSNSGFDTGGVELYYLTFTDPDNATPVSITSGIATSTAYRWHWVEISRDAGETGEHIDLGECRFFITNPVLDMTLVNPTAVTVAAAPIWMDCYCLYKDDGNNPESAVGGTWNPADKSAATTLSNGNLDAALAGGYGVRGTTALVVPSTGVAVFEAALTVGSYAFVGFANAAWTYGYTESGGGKQFCVFYSADSQAFTHTGAVSPPVAEGFAAGSGKTASLRLNLATGEVQLHVNGVWRNSYTLPAGTYYPATSSHVGGSTVRATFAAPMAYATPGGAAVLGTDCTIDLSRDNGTTWTPATIATVAAYDSTYTLIRGRADVSGQPSGTAMKVRIKTLNTKAQRIAAPALYTE